MRAAGKVLSVLLSRFNGTIARRMMLFDALPGPYTVANHPRESYVVNVADKIIGRILFFRGDFDFAKFERAFAILRDEGLLPGAKEPPTLIDVGANVGSICIPAIKRGFVARSLAFEPDHENFRLLRINSLLNDVDHLIEAHQAAIGDREGLVQIVRSDTNFGDHRVCIGSGDDAAQVHMTTLDSFCNGLDLSNLILWMDIQGFEGFALQGARRFREAGVPLIFEFCKSDLEASGSYDLLKSALAGSAYTTLYDLNESEPVGRPLTGDTLDELGESLDRRHEFTDLLVVPARHS